MMLQLCAIGSLPVLCTDTLSMCGGGEGWGVGGTHIAEVHIRRRPRELRAADMAREESAVHEGVRPHTAVPIGVADGTAISGRRSYQRRAASGAKNRTVMASKVHTGGCGCGSGSGSDSGKTLAAHWQWQWQWQWTDGCRTGWSHGMGQLTTRLEVGRSSSCRWSAPPRPRCLWGNGGSCVIPVILSVRGTKAAQAVHSAGEGRGGSRTARPHHQRSVPAAGLCARPCAGAAGQNSAASTCGRRVCAVWQVCVCCVCAVCMCVCVCMLLCVSLWQQLEAASHRGVTD